MSSEVDRGQRPSIYGRPMPFLGSQHVRSVMMMTERDEAILDTLTNRVKVLGVGQIHRLWWLDSGVSAVQARLKVLCDADWLVPVRLTVRSTDFFPSRPLFSSAASGAEPAWPDLLSVTRSRWNVPLRSIAGVVASQRAARFFGGHARHPRPSEATHDLFLAGVYLRVLEERVIDGQAWLGEAQLAAEAHGTAGVIPDAMIRREPGSVAIEVVGESYTEAKLKAFHQYCGERNWGYELW
jgi:hypothetical protein